MPIVGRSAEELPAHRALSEAHRHLSEAGSRRRLELNTTARRSGLMWPQIFKESP